MSSRVDPVYLLTLFDESEPSGDSAKVVRDWVLHATSGACAHTDLAAAQGTALDWGRELARDYDATLIVPPWAEQWTLKAGDPPGPADPNAWEVRFEFLGRESPEQPRGEWRAYAHARIVKVIPRTTPVQTQAPIYRGADAD